jgi:hypothetical protein
MLGETQSCCLSSKVSKIWQYGIELRALNSSNLDKYWLCHQCLPATQIYKIGSSEGNSSTGKLGASPPYSFFAHLLLKTAEKYSAAF